MSSPADANGGGTSRRGFLKAAGLGAVGTVAVARGMSFGRAAADTTTLALAATDGYVTMPGREDNPVYIFGFIPVDPNATVTQLEQTYKGHAQTSAPTIEAVEEQDVTIKLTNLGLVQRPDLIDSHTVHWHGFDVPSPLNDGVPEVSVAVPINKQVTYFYRPHRAGTYMYHCHFEDVEHVQMGMTGIVFVRPLQDGHTINGFSKFAYNDLDGSTGYNRHFAVLLNEIWTLVHDNDRDIQETIETDWDPDWFVLNGRAYPQTVKQNDVRTNLTSSTYTTTSGITTVNTTLGTSDVSQPNSSLLQAGPGERVLLRLANLGYTQHAMELPGVPMHVVGQDASLLRNGSVDTSYWTNTLYLGPGEARDVLIQPPAYSPTRPGGTDNGNPYNVYYFRNQDWRKLSNGGAPGLGGMMTELRVYRDVVPAQTFVSQVFNV